MNTKKKMAIAAVVVILVIVGIFVHTGTGQDKAAVSEKAETQANTEEKSPEEESNIKDTVGETPSAVEISQTPTVSRMPERTEKTKENSSADMEEAAGDVSADQPDQNTQNTQAVEGPDGEVILVPETPNTGKDDLDSEVKANASTTEQSIELPIVPGEDE